MDKWLDLIGENEEKILEAGKAAYKVEFLEVARFCENGILTNSTLKELGREF